MHADLHSGKVSRRLNVRNQEDRYRPKVAETGSEAVYSTELTQTTGTGGKRPLLRQQAALNELLDRSPVGVNTW